jgi:hypothetical protein
MTHIHDEKNMNNDNDYKTWITEVYNVNLMSNQELDDYYSEIQYHGFNRDSILRSFYSQVDDPRDAVKLVLLCAIRGPVKAYQISRQIGLSRYNIPMKAGKENNDISFNRITACTADIAAYYLKKMNVPKRINCDCPAWLQFPTAASITMPNNIRMQHKEFSTLFSERLPDPTTESKKSTFREEIYEQQVLNSYYNPSLNLF